VTTGKAQIMNTISSVSTELSAEREHGHQRQICQSSDLNVGRVTDLKTSEVIPEISFTVSREIVDFACIGIGDSHEWYTKASPLGEPIAPPVEAWFSAIRATANHVYGELRGALYETPALIHAYYEVRHRGAPRVGETVKIKGECTNRYRKRGREYVDLAHVVHGEDGRLIYETKATFVHDYKQKELQA
jgi:hypothetical protein